MAKTDVLQGQFENHVKNLMSSITSATPSQKERGSQWYPQAHDQMISLAVAEQPSHPNEHNDEGDEYNLDAPEPGANLTGKDYVPPSPQRRATGEIAALSPTRPAGMRWEQNVPAAHQLRDITNEQRRLLDTAVAANAARSKAEGIRRKARNSGVGVPEAEASYDQAQADFQAKSDTARAPFKDTPLGHAGVEAISKAHDIHTGKADPLESLGQTKARHFSHDLQAPYNADEVFHGASGVVDQHMANVIEGPGNRRGWSEEKHGRPRTMPDIGRPAGYVYARAVVHEASRRLGMRPNAAQATSWLQEKESKPRVGNRGNR